ncbi:Acetyltransferase (GNAT) family protein [Rhizobium sp. NFR07]|uniref:GNAT family N-acetyltransferase n=1 Tax=Rhizobium sp. NFR07 TaxID=1566262 RepID=UPI0008EC45E7|nr:GNAT family N-acetyltransferase [Rhizobium sp. NFR07]SFB45466.1 Acetyltransferase (GNAT) family protein [Rhizobium sp. NFR07]
MATIELTASPSGEHLDVILKGLTAYNEAEVGPADRIPLAVLIRDDGGDVIGGLSGYTSWGWLFTQLLFIPEQLRGQGMAAKLLDAAENEARGRGCGGAWIDTFNPLALKAYQRQGYEIFGELPAFVGDRTRTFLRKKL